MDEQHDEAQTEEQVRRLLAAASPAPGPELPPDVAARLDDVLAGLVSERSAEQPGTAAGPVPDEAAEVMAVPVPADEVVGVAELGSRRRRRWPQLLVAAAAVSVLGLGIGNLMEAGSPTAVTDGASSAGSAADDGGGQAESSSRSGAAKERDTDSHAADKDVPDDLSGGAAPETQEAPPQLHTGVITADVQRVEDQSLAAPVTRTPPRWGDACVRPATSPGDEWVRVRLDGAAAVLVLRAPDGGRRTADVFTCDDARTPAVSTTVRAR